MAKNFKILQSKMAPESRARSEAKAQEMIRTMVLDELRETMGLTQAQLASVLKVNQLAISKLERRTDRGLPAAHAGS